VVRRPSATPPAVVSGPPSVAGVAGKQFFFEKKNQKTFIHLG
jgi:hypothetical protein